MNLMEKPKKIRLFFPFLLLICWGLLFIAGCGFTSPEAAFSLGKSYGKNLKALEKGNHALKTGDIQKARDIFQNLQQQASDPVIQMHCMYGLACAELAMADNAAEFEAALELWNQWIEQIPPGSEGGDPRLLYPFLTSRLAAKKELYSRNQDLKSRMHKQNSKNLRAKNRNIEALNAKLKTKNQEIRQLKQKLDHLKTRIQTLEHQINAMKAIDQKIQEKKEEIAAP